MQFFIKSALLLAALAGTSFAVEAEAASNQGEDQIQIVRRLS
jgi:hypothetical protein